MTQINTKQLNIAQENKRLETRIDLARSENNNPKQETNELLTNVLQQKTTKKVLTETASVFQTDNKEKKPFAEQRLLDNKALSMPLMQVAQQAILNKRDIDFNQQAHRYMASNHSKDSIHAHDPLQNENSTDNQASAHQLNASTKKPFTPVKKREGKEEKEKNKINLDINEKQTKKNIIHDVSGFLLWILNILQYIIKFLIKMYKLFLKLIGIDKTIKVKKIRKKFRAKLRYKMHQINKSF